ncbi:MAG: discoidin domain-containing protein [Leptospiraceae bacterium]|nr:discoidin domain-containing protein [Leptospiraceae bacterium]
MSDISVKISHPSEVFIQAVETKGQFDLEKGRIMNFIDDSNAHGVSSLILNFKEISSFNSIQFEAKNNEVQFLPDTFRFEVSEDGKIWESIIKEYDYSRSNKKFCKWNFPMITSKYLKLLTKFNKKDKNGKFKVVLSNLKISITGIEKIQASSEYDRFWVKENIIDQRTDYGWSSKESLAPTEEFILVDLGSNNRVDEFRILTKNAIEQNFPELFYFYYSEDDLTWHQLHEEPRFLAESGTWYKWKFFPTNMRFFKLVMINNRPNTNKKYLVQFIELEVYAAPDYLSLSKKKIINETPPYSSMMRSGLVRLAADGETNAGVAVQGNDRRLRDATTEFKGIVELATDGEDKPLVVVQGNDKRLKEATESSSGIVKLASSGETRASTVVQGSDERLKQATTESLGIVELASDGETRPGTVVQGNDKRLKNATTKEYGLVILSELGGDKPGQVVTADDPRFKKATTEHEGILRFATNGEEQSFAAVQGNDKRLKPATTESLGIVELAHSGEDKPNVVVQGDDERLKPASTIQEGIVKFSLHNTNLPLLAVQADDPRLYDRRDPKDHNHEYADKIHSYDSHSGLINITESTSSELINIVQPTTNHSVIYGKNDSKGGSGVSGIGIDEGVVGFGEDIGILGLSNGQDDESSGVAGFSKKGYGGVFISTKNYSIFANGTKLGKRLIDGSGKAILAKGRSDFLGKTFFINESGNECIAKFFKNSSSEIIQKGDIVIASEKELGVTRVKSPYSTKIVGVCVDSSPVILGEEKQGNEFILVAFSGIVKVNVDASVNVGGQISFGDLLVSSLTGGHGSKADNEKIKPGMLLGKSFGELKKDRGQIFAILTLS